MNPTPTSRTTSTTTRDPMSLIARLGDHAATRLQAWRLERELALVRRNLAGLEPEHRREVLELTLRWLGLEDLDALAQGSPPTRYRTMRGIQPDREAALRRMASGNAVLLRRGLAMWLSATHRETQPAAHRALAALHHAIERELRLLAASIACEPENDLKRHGLEFGI